jgi:hypothetical protein
MAKNTKSDEFFQRLRAQGLRKRTAKLISQASDRRRKPPTTVQQTLDNLKQLVSEAEDRLSGRSANRKEAARKAAKTRKANARSRSAAAKKGARTRAKASK